MPTISGTPDNTVTIGKTYGFTPVATDPTGKGLTFTIHNKPAWANFGTATGQLWGTPTAVNQGTDGGIFISAKNSSGIASLPAFYIMVKSVNSPPVLESIAVSPLTLRMRPGFTQQLSIVGTFSDASTQILPARYVSFQSSNINVAAVDPATGVLTIAATTSAGATAIISATETAAGLMTLPAASAVVKVIAPNTGPTANSVAAATATVTNNPLCGSPIAPYYWEIGDQYGPAIGGSVGIDATGQPVQATSSVSVASASKFIYGTYVMQLRGSVAKLSAADVDFLNFTSGYTNMGSEANVCPGTNSPNTVNQCLTLTNSLGVSYAAQDPTTVGTFNYNDGHMENHASQLTSLGNIDAGSLGQIIQSLLGANLNLLYTEPLMAGGIYATGQAYAQVLRNVLSGSLAMRDALGTHPVCTRHSTTCNATYSPIPEAWHYSIGHWVEDDPTSNGDGAFSSPGMYGFYPWIDATKSYYGIISRENTTGSGLQQGYASAQCGRLVRRAWMTGVEQTGSLPTGQ